MHDLLLKLEAVRDLKIAEVAIFQTDLTAIIGAPNENLLAHAAL